MKAVLAIFALAPAVISCQLLGPEAIPDAGQQQAPSPTDARASATQAASSATLARIALQPIAPALGSPFSEVQLRTWVPQDYAGEDYPLPLNLESASNPDVLAGLTADQMTTLSRNGFVVMHSQEEQFYTIREQVARINGQPYFLTTDAAFHVLHLTFDDLLKALEQEHLRPRMIALLVATLEELQSYQPALEGTSLEAEARQAVAYMSVALGLFDPPANPPAELAEVVQAQIDQILAEGGRDNSVLFPSFEDDYGAYRPVGHYAGDPELEAYFRGMTWFGRVHFKLADEQPSRVPLLITLALRRTPFPGGIAADSWSEIQELLDFLVGPTDDAGPPEYATLMDQAYGDNMLPTDLADEDRWDAFQRMGDQLPAPRINSTFLDSLADLEHEAGWRFMGQRFTLDAFIFQNLVFDQVAPLDGVRRLLPKGPDLMAALGSQAAAEALEQLGETAYPGYPEQMEAMQLAVQARPEAEWLGRSYDAWLYAFLPVLQEKDPSFPAFMRTFAWAYKDLNAALGSWAELKHDTILYAKMPEGAGGGGPPCTSGPPPGYVEPNPSAFYRMAYVAQTISQGLLDRGLIVDPETHWMQPGLDSLNAAMAEFGNRLLEFGDIAAKELAGIPLDADDHAAIQRCLGPSECSAQVAGRPMSENDDEIPPPPIVAAVAGGGADVLEVGTGYVDRILVAVPIAGRMALAQGGVYSYFEFHQPRSARLTDEAWRERLASTDAPELPPWAEHFVLPGGGPTEVVGFYVGAAYALTEAGDDLRLRAQPSLSGSIVDTLTSGVYLQAIGGPVEADSYTWWEFENCFTGETGWAVQDPAWYDRDWQ